MRIARLLLIAFVAMSCSTGEGSPAAPAPPPRADPVTACTNQIVYWAGAALRGEDDGGDYQHHGLTSEQHDALLAVVADAEAQGSALPPDHVARQARAACERIATLPPTGF